MPSPRFVLIIQPLSPPVATFVVRQRAYIGRTTIGSSPNRAEQFLANNFGWRPESQAVVSTHPGYASYRRYYRRLPSSRDRSFATWELLNHQRIVIGHIFLYREDSIGPNFFPDGWVWSPSEPHAGPRPVQPPPVQPHRPTVQARRFGLDRVYATDKWKD